MDQAGGETIVERNVKVGALYFRSLPLLHFTFIIILAAFKHQ